MFKRLLQLLSISCRHKRTTKPFATVYSAAAGTDWLPVGSGAGHYVVCLDCGKKFVYDWSRMQILKQ